MKRQAHSNRLAKESSPYLLQHAQNPVNWYAWGDEALEASKRQDKPILLSIGYSACHWCHVMAHECFENEAIAELMNAHFINIKVDREERPDLDQIYQNAVQLFIRRGGGWPLTMFLTPEKVPFYGGTYFPPIDRHQLPGFPKVLQAMHEAWNERPDDIAQTVQNVQTALLKSGASKRTSSKNELPADLLEKAVKALSRIFDAKNGGFGSAPKFPGVPSLALFLRHAHQSGEEAALKKVTFTLRKMAWGGIYDQVGGGFHRYSVDEQWQVPHFEKMLYDNAQLACLYFWTFQASGDTFFKKIGIEILDYVLREMTSPEGGFYSAQDADSEGGEGHFFIWRPEEIRSVLGEEKGDIFCRHYNISDAGNFEGQNIPHLSHSMASLAEAFGKPLADISEIIQASREEILRKRESRPKPTRDEKILCNWNSLMISAFVTGYEVTAEPRFLLAAENAANFMLRHFFRNGRLLHTYKNGIAKLNAYLDDVAFFMDALTDLFEVTGKPTYLSHAKSLAETLGTRFWDAEAGGCYFTSDDHEVLIDRLKPAYDPSIPSGNAIAAQAFQRLSSLTGEARYRERGEAILRTFVSEMGANCFGAGSLIAAADLLLRGPQEIHISGDRNAAETKTLLAKINQLYLPNKVISFKDEASDDKGRGREKDQTDEEPTVVICENFSCSPPLKRWQEIRERLLEAP